MKKTSVKLLTGILRWVGLPLRAVVGLTVIVIILLVMLFGATEEQFLNDISGIVNWIWGK